jgi:hypothetical protein
MRRSGDELFDVFERQFVVPARVVNNAKVIARTG